MLKRWPSRFLGHLSRESIQKSELLLPSRHDRRVSALYQGQRMDVADKLNMRPVFSVPLFGMESEAVALHRLCFSIDSPSHLLAGSLTGDIFQADLKKAEGGITFPLSDAHRRLYTGSDHPEITESVICAHAGAVVVLERSPFFDDIFLSVGGWTFRVWKDGHSFPLFHSPCSAHKYTSGRTPPPATPIHVTDASA